MENDLGRLWKNPTTQTILLLKGHMNMEEKSVGPTEEYKMSAANFYFDMYTLISKRIVKKYFGTL